MVETMNLDFLGAYFLTIVTETVILFLLLRKTYPAKTILVNSLIANVTTLPFVWFVFPLLPLTYPVQIAISEIFAFVVEGFVYAKLFSKLPLKRAFFVSFLCNLVSFLTGLIYVVLMVFYLSPFPQGF